MALVSGPKSGIVVGVCLHFIVVTISVIGFSAIEGWSFLDSFYMTILSVSTVGFSEVNPLSQAGRVFAAFVIVAGLGTVFYTTTMLGRVILEGEFRGTLRRRSMQKKIHDLRGHSVICGFGRTGRVVADELHEDGFPFCVIEYNRDEEEALRDSGYLFVIGDATEEHVLEEAGIEHANAVLALLTSDADNLYLTINAKELNPKAKVVARALDDTAERRLKRAGADNVVATFKLSAHRVLQAAVRPTVNEFIELVGDRGQLSLIMEEIVVSAGSAVISQSLEKAGVRAQYGVIIVTIKKTGGDMIFNPPGTVTFEDGDTLIALGEEEGLQRLGAACRSV